MTLEGIAELNQLIGYVYNVLGNKALCTHHFLQSIKSAEDPADDDSSVHEKTTVRAIHAKITGEYSVEAAEEYEYLAYLYWKENKPVEARDALEEAILIYSLLSMKEERIRLQSINSQAELHFAGEPAFLQIKEHTPTKTGSPQGPSAEKRNLAAAIPGLKNRGDIAINKNPLVCKLVFDILCTYHELFPEDKTNHIGSYFGGSISNKIIDFFQNKRFQASCEEQKDLEPPVQQQDNFLSLTQAGETLADPKDSLRDHDLFFSITLPRMKQVLEKVASTSDDFLFGIDSIHDTGYGVIQVGLRNGLAVDICCYPNLANPTKMILEQHAEEHILFYYHGCWVILTSEQIAQNNNQYDPNMMHLLEIIEGSLAHAEQQVMELFTKNIGGKIQDSSVILGRIIDGLSLGYTLGERTHAWVIAHANLLLSQLVLQENNKTKAQYQQLYTYLKRKELVPIQGMELTLKQRDAQAACRSLQIDFPIMGCSLMPDQTYTPFVPPSPQIEYALQNTGFFAPQPYLPPTTPQWQVVHPAFAATHHVVQQSSFYPLMPQIMFFTQQPESPASSSTPERAPSQRGGFFYQRQQHRPSVRQQAPMTTLGAMINY